MQSEYHEKPLDSEMGKLDLSKGKGFRNKRVNGILFAVTYNPPLR